MSVKWLLWAVIYYELSWSAVSETSKCEFSNARNCLECMLTHSDCVWIADKNVSTSERCTIESMSHNAKKVIIGKKALVQPTEDKDFQLPSGNDEPGIQIRPQKIKLRIRINETTTFQLRYKALSDYPLDIYYLLDQTNSMRKHRENLQTLGGQLASSLANLTKDYRIAFGYFSDKVAMPYYAMAPKLLANPCLVIDQTCAPGSNFVHLLNFTKDTDAFIRLVSSINFTANMDDLEGSFDALLQIILCQRELSWRNHARKMIVLATDGWTHFAGDGLLAGIVNKHPSSCSMRNVDGQYIYEGLEYDYPSVEEVFKQLLAAKISLLLAIQEKEDQQGRNAAYYKEMKSLMDEVALYDELDNDPQNIIRMVETGFRDKIKKVKFKLDGQPEYLKFSSESFCNGTELNQTWSCWDVKLDTEYVFNISVLLTQLPTHGRVDILKIEEMYLHESVEIEVDYPERCICDSEPNTDPTINGVESCGIYICHEKWVGERCDKRCDRSMGRFSNNSHTSYTCSKNGDFDENSCSCICDRGYSGEYCEYECEANKYGHVCSNNGKCKNGKCECFKEFSGDICDCPTSIKTCINSVDTKPCSNHGKCECGNCVCDENPEAQIKYFGDFCQNCNGCHKCFYNEVLLKHIAGKLNVNERKTYTFYNDDEYDDEFKCSVEHSPNSTHYCYINYSVTKNETVIIRYHQDCDSSVETYYIAAIGTATIVLMALVLILLIWKTYTIIKDRRIWAQFEKAKERTSFQPNQIYKSPITTYENPKRE